MFFIDLRFLLLVAGCCVTFVAVPGRFRPHVLTGWGAAFYAVYAPFAGLLALIFLLLAFFIDGPRARWIVIALLVGLLAYFKRPTTALAAAAGMTDLRAGGVIGPLGFSFLAVELIHYVIERGRGRIGVRSFMDLAAYVFFFPCRVAGPIKRYNAFTTAVASAAFASEDVSSGCLRIVSGLFKKAALARLFGRWAQGIGGAATPAEAWVAMLAYSLELYFDFSAYSDIAIGISRLMGVRIAENFRWPYLSPNIQEFWSRWHISLSSWARDYVFMTVGRQLFSTRFRSRPAVIAASSYAATFLAMAAWHGLKSNYFVWGAYHAVLVSGHHFYSRALPMGVVDSAFYQSRLFSVCGTAFTFVLVTIGWVFFRMDLPDAVRVIRLMLNI